MNVSRRHFLSQAGLVAGGTLALDQTGAALGAARPRAAKSAAPKSPTRVIHMVADGMSMGTFTCANLFSQLLRKRDLAWLRLSHRPETSPALMNMRSLSSVVTDSAAASSSWGSGSRVANGSLNILPDGRPLRTLYQLFREEGWARGLVTTTEITHATPAGFAAHGKRENAENIALEYLDLEVDVLLGGGQQYFDPKERKDKRDLWIDFASRGYTVAKTRKELERAPTRGRWLGVFTKGHLPFTLDHLNSADLTKNVPTLAEMTRRALDRLEHEPRFILQVEGGRVDHACHGCDIATALHDMIAFDEAIEVCRDFQARNPHTLIVITSDHGNGNPGLNGTGDGYNKSDLSFARLLKFKRSFSEIAKKLEKLPAGQELAAVKEVLADSFGFEPEKKRVEALLPFLAKKGFTIYDHMNSSHAQLGQLVAQSTGVGWSGSAHTADYVPVHALGPGSERFTGLVQNTEVFQNYLTFAEIRYRNPESKLLASSGPSASEVEPVTDWV